MDLDLLMALDNQLKTDEDGSIKLNSIGIVKMNTQRQSHHKFITQQRSLEAVNYEILCSLREFLKQRFSNDQNLLTIIKPFVHLSPHTNLQDIHKSIGEYIDLQELALEYEELLSMENIHQLRTMNLNELFKTLCTSHFINIVTLFARILVAIPHSADVERLISASNLLKSQLRSTMSVTTENMYLYIHYNMPPLYEWDPNMSIVKWIKSKKHRIITRK